MPERIGWNLKASWHKFFGIFLIVLAVSIAASPVIFRLYPDDTLEAVLFSSVYGVILALAGRDCMKDHISATIGAGVSLFVAAAFSLLVSWDPGSEGTWGTMVRFSVAGVAVLLGVVLLVRGVHLRFEKEKEIRRWREVGRAGARPGSQEQDSQASEGPADSQSRAGENGGGSGH